MTRHEDMSRCDVCHVSGGDSCDSVTDADLLRLHTVTSADTRRGRRNLEEKISPQSQSILFFLFK